MYGHVVCETFKVVSIPILLFNKPLKLFIIYLFIIFKT